MRHVRYLNVVAFAAVVFFSTSLACAGPIQPNLVGLDFNFSYSGASYDASTQTLTASGTYAVVTFQPVSGGTTYPVYNVDGNPAGAFDLIAVFDTLGSDFDVDGYFQSLGLSAPDLVIGGEIAALGLTGGTLIEADVIALEIYGSAGSLAFAFNGYFEVTGGDLVTEGYIGVGDTIGMASWLTSVSPSLSAGYAFHSDFSATTHMGEIGSVPEPGTAVLLALAGITLLARRRRRR